jgi:hypothetical protein
MLFNHAANAMWTLRRTRDYLVALSMPDRVRLERTTRHDTSDWLDELSACISYLDQGHWPTVGSAAQTALIRWSTLTAKRPIPAPGPKRSDLLTLSMCYASVLKVIEAADQTPPD